VGTGGSRTKIFRRRSKPYAQSASATDALLNDLERSGEEQISLTDADSRAMAA